MSKNQSQKLPVQDRFLEQLHSQTARIGIIGLGYVGLPLAVAFSRQGFSTVGFDVSNRRVQRLNQGQSYIDDVDDKTLSAVVDKGAFRAQVGFDGADAVDVFYICVPTPVTPHKDPDTSYIETAARSISKHLRAGQLIVLKSTTHPNTTEGVVQPILEKAGQKKDLQLGTDYFLAYSPERVDPGNKTYTTSNTPVVVGGVTETCTALAAEALQQIVQKVHQVSSPRVAEMEKLLENIFRSVNIALVNEMAQLCDRMGDVSIWEVIEAAKTKPFGFMPFYPGPGLGGHCIPIDPYYLSWLARRYDFETSFITLSARVNEEMPYYVEDAVIRAIAEQPIQLSKAKILLLGVAFKPNVNDTRRSPAYRIFRLLHKRGLTHIDYSDPHVPEWSVSVDNQEIQQTSVGLTKESIRSYDAVVVITDHADFPYEMIAKHAKAIVDCRNALDNVSYNKDKVYLLGGGRF